MLELVGAVVVFVAVVLLDVAEVDVGLVVLVVGFAVLVMSVVLEPPYWLNEDKLNRRLS